MDDLKTTARNTAASLLTAIVVTSTAYALWLGVPLLNSAVDHVFASDIPVVRLSPPQIAAHGAQIDYAAVVGANRQLVIDPKPVPAPRATVPPVSLSRLSAVAPVAKTAVAKSQVAKTAAARTQAAKTAAGTKTSTATTAVASIAAASKVAALTVSQPAVRTGSSARHTAKTGRHGGKATARHHAKSSRHTRHRAR